MPLAPNQQSESLLWAESNQCEKVPSDFTEPPGGIWTALGKAMWPHLPEWLLGIETQKKIIKREQWIWKSFETCSAMNMQGQLQSRAEVGLVSH